MDDKRYYTRKEVAEMFEVTTATVSGWLDRGVLSGIRVTHVWHIDRAGVDAMRDGLKELGSMERKAAALKRELDAVVREREGMISEARRDNGILRHLPSFVELVGKFADVMSVGDKDKARYVVTSFIGGVPTSEIAAELGLTASRVRQILYAAFGRMNKFQSYNELRGELSACNRRLEEAKIRINGLKSAVAAYEELDKNIMRGAGEITIARVLLVPTEELNLSRRAINGLTRVGVKVNGMTRHPKNLGQLVQVTGDEIRSVRTLGRKSLFEIEGCLNVMGLRLGMSVDDVVRWSRGTSELVNVSRNDIDFHKI